MTKSVDMLHLFSFFYNAGKTPDESVLSTIVTPNKITTIEGDSATTKITSSMLGVVRNS